MHNLPVTDDEARQMHANNAAKIRSVMAAIHREKMNLPPRIMNGMDGQFQNILNDLNSHALVLERMAQGNGK